MITEKYIFLSFSRNDLHRVTPVGLVGVQVGSKICSGYVLESRLSLLKDIQYKLLDQGPK